MRGLLLTSALIIFMLSACVPPAYQSSQTPLHNTKAAVDTAQADASFKEGRYDEATAQYKVLSLMHPDEHDIRFKWAESLRLSGHPTEASEQYVVILKSEPTAFHAKEGLALTLLQQHKTDRAKKLLLELLKEDASRWRTINALGILHSLEDKTDEANEYFEMALAVAPNEPAILNNVGLVNAITGHESTTAIETLKEALTLASSERAKRQVTLNLALAYGMAGDDEQARNLLEPILSEAEIYNNLGVYAHLRKDKALAKTYLSKALTSQPVFYEKAWENLEKINSELSE